MLIEWTQVSNCLGTFSFLQRETNSIHTDQTKRNKTKQTRIHLGYNFRYDTNRRNEFFSKMKKKRTKIITIFNSLAEMREDELKFKNFIP